MNETQIQEAAKLWRRGETAEAIAKAIGVPVRKVRYAAELNRELFPYRLKVAAAAKQAAVCVAAVKVRPAIVVPERFPPKAPGHNGVPRGQLTGCGCEFPLWGDHERYDLKKSLYCGAAKDDGNPYCTFHRKVTTGLGTPSERAAVSVLARAA